jgi:hypothetical protein
MSGERCVTGPDSARRWSHPLLLLAAGGGALGLLPGLDWRWGGARPSPPVLAAAAQMAALVWLGLWCLPAGTLAGSVPHARSRDVLLAPLLWGLFLWIAARGGAQAPLWPWAWALVTGVFLAGCALGRALSAGGASGAAAAWLLFLAALCALPERGGLGASPPSVGFARAALWASPATWVLESAGVDWMRQRAVYDALQSDRFERRGVRGQVAGPLALVVGWSLWTLARARGRPRSAATRE